jgi:hypothetical protein
MFPVGSNIFIRMCELKFLSSWILSSFIYPSLDPEVPIPVTTTPALSLKIYVSVQTNTGINNIIYNFNMNS